LKIARHPKFNGAPEHLLKLPSQSNRNREAAMEELYGLFLRLTYAASEIVDAKVSLAQNIRNSLARC
jgi:hypothetical protein